MSECQCILMAKVCSGTSILWATEFQESKYSHYAPGRLHCPSICPSEASGGDFVALQLGFSQACDEWQT